MIGSLEGPALINVDAPSIAAYLSVSIRLCRRQCKYILYSVFLIHTYLPREIMLRCVYNAVTEPCTVPASYTKYVSIVWQLASSIYFGSPFTPALTPSKTRRSEIEVHKRGKFDLQCLLRT